MDQQQFDAVTRSMSTPASRRTGLKALVGGLLGAGVAAVATQTDAKRKRDKCPDNRRCGGECCRAGFGCVLGECQMTQNWCYSENQQCNSSLSYDDCCSGYKCFNNVCRKAQLGESCRKRICSQVSSYCEVFYPAEICAEGTCSESSPNCA